MPIVRSRRYRFRSAITGRFIKMTTWLRWPRLTIREKIVVAPHDDFPDGK